MLSNIGLAGFKADGIEVNGHHDSTSKSVSLERYTDRMAVSVYHDLGFTKQAKSRTGDLTYKVDALLPRAPLGNQIDQGQDYCQHLKARCVVRGWALQVTKTCRAILRGLSVGAQPTGPSLAAVHEGPLLSSRMISRWSAHSCGLFSLPLCPRECQPRVPLFLDSFRELQPMVLEERHHEIVPLTAQLVDQPLCERTLLHVYNATNAEGFQFMRLGKHFEAYKQLWCGPRAIFQVEPRRSWSRSCLPTLPLSFGRREEQRIVLQSPMMPLCVTAASMVRMPNRLIRLSPR